MARTSGMRPPSPTMMKSGYVKTLAPPFVACPKCGEMSLVDRGKVWYVSDERGLHGECDVCSHAWDVRVK